MPDYTVGAGIRQRMLELGDAPAANSRFHTVEIARGERYDYYADNALGEWRVRAEPVGEADPTPEPAPALKIVWKGSPNYAAGRLGRSPVAIVLHTAEGTLPGMDAWFANTASQVSAHYGVGLGGTVHQYVDLANTAWANGVLGTGNRWPFGQANPNPVTVSIETEDKRDPALPVSDAQYQAVRALCRQVRAEYPTISHLVAHRAIDTGRSCPGPRWVESGLIVRLAGELGLTLVV